MYNRLNTKIMDYKDYVMKQWERRYTEPDENHYSDEIICVVDRANDKIAFDGKTWKDIEDDHL